MKKFLSILVAFCVCAFGLIVCNENSEEKRQRDERWEKESGETFQNTVWYYKDWNVDVCYSMVNSPRGYGFSHATVPCTDKVMKKIINKREKPCVDKCYKNSEKADQK
ncbi:MAG: hypothetical protein V1661_02665 [bacterium]